MYTLPSQEDLEAAEAMWPEYMRPNALPYAVVIEGYLNEQQCTSISSDLDDIPTYTFGSCGAVTREIDRHQSLVDIELAGRAVNMSYWDYDLDDGHHSWMQTYEAGGDYHRHADSSPGQTRKLTAVALLSDPDEYVGGELVIYGTEGQRWFPPRTRGTVVIFQAHIQHEVLMVESGLRQTINMGFWGPPFK